MSEGRFRAKFDDFQAACPRVGRNVTSHGIGVAKRGLLGVKIPTPELPHCEVDEESTSKTGVPSSIEPFSPRGVRSAGSQGRDGATGSRWRRTRGVYLLPADAGWREPRERTGGPAWRRKHEWLRDRHGPRAENGGKTRDRGAGRRGSRGRLEARPEGRGAVRVVSTKWILKTEPGPDTRLSFAKEGSGKKENGLTNGHHILASL